VFRGGQGVPGSHGQAKTRPLLAAKCGDFTQKRWEKMRKTSGISAKNKGFQQNMGLNMIELGSDRIRNTGFNYRFNMIHMKIWDL
jgi:hypothetical protein